MNLFLRFYSWFVFILELFLLLFTFILDILECLWRLVVPAKKKNIFGEVVLVTGGGNGIGKELCLQLGKLGAKVVCWDINKEFCDEVVTKIRAEDGRAWGWVVDVSNREAVLKAAKEVQDLVGHVTILVNNAGIMTCQRLLDHSHKDIRRVMDINVLAHFWTLEAFLESMLSLDRGHIVSVSSVAGHGGAANLVPYCTSKFAVNGMMESLEMELKHYADDGIKVTTVYPFIVDTGLVQNPQIRFPSVFSIANSEQAASIIMNGILTEATHVWIPSGMKFLKYILTSLPRKTAVELSVLLGVTCDPHEPRGWRDTIVKGSVISS